MWGEEGLGLCNQKKTLQVVTTSRLESADQADTLDSLGQHYLCRFDWFGNIQDLDSAVKHLLEAVASIPLNHPGRDLRFSTAWEFRIGFVLNDLV